MNFKQFLEFITLFWADHDISTPVWSVTGRIIFYVVFKILRKISTENQKNKIHDRDHVSKLDTQLKYENR